MIDDKLIDKLIVLFVFDKFNIPLTFGTVQDTCYSNEWVDYFQVRPILDSLVKNNFLLIISRSPDALYRLTQDGRDCLTHFYQRIPANLRDDITKFVEKNSVEYRKKQEYLSDYRKNPDGTYTVVLKIMNFDKCIMELKAEVPDRDKARWLHKSWTNRAAAAYECVQENILS